VTLARLRVPPRSAEIQSFLADNAQFRAEPLRVDRFSLIASYPTKAGSVYEDQADYELQG
jgi:2'-5' RNA ligase